MDVREFVQYCLIPALIGWFWRDLWRWIRRKLGQCYQYLRKRRR